MEPRLIDANEGITWANENLPDAHKGVIIAFLLDCATVETAPVVHVQKQEMPTQSFSSVILDRMCGKCETLVNSKDTYCPLCGAIMDLEG